MADDHQILSLCMKILDNFDERKCGIDDHLKDFIDVRLGDDAECLLVDEIVTGCVRYKALIKVLLELFYARDGITCLRADYSLYSVISLLAMFRLEDMGVSRFKRVVSTQSTAKMYKLLAFLFNKDNLNGLIKEEWSRVYDPIFVTMNIVTPMLRFIGEMEEYTSYLADKLANRTNAKVSSKPPTEAKPFKLTKPVPRIISYEVEEIPAVKPHKPVPQSTYRKPAEELSLAGAFEANRRKAENTFLEAERTQFSCASTEKSEKTQRIMEKIKDEQEAKIKLSPIKPVPIPASLKESCPVKLNSTVIFREGARIQREEALLQEKFARLEAGDGDVSKYMEWQQELKEKSAAEKAAEIERKHLAGQISHEEAFLAKQQSIQDKKDMVQKLRSESQEVMAQYFTQKEHEKLEMRRLVEATSAGQTNVREARAKLTAMKQKIVQQVAQENQELMAKALEQEEIEMRKKSELIRQIHAMETVPIIRANFLDLTQTSGLGFLSEMSIVELRERLSLMKIAEEEEMREKRMAIKGTKEAKEQHLSKTVESIAQYKTEKKRQSAAKREDSKRIFTAHHAQLKAQTIDALQDKLENKRKERLRQQKLSTQAFPASAKNYRSSIKPIQSQSASSLPYKPHPTSRTDLPTTTVNTWQHLVVSPPVNPMATLIQATSKTT